MDSLPIIIINPLLLPEIIDLIGTHLTRLEITSSLRVCSLWHAVLEPLLYRDFILPHKQQKNNRAMKRARKQAKKELEKEGLELSGLLDLPPPEESCTTLPAFRIYLARYNNGRRRSRRLWTPLLERNARHIRSLTTSSLTMLECLSTTCYSMEKWTFMSHVDMRVPFLIVMNRTTLRTVHLMFPRSQLIGSDEVNALAALFTVMDQQLTGLQELALEHTRIRMDEPAGPPLVNLCRRRRGLHLDIRRLGVVDWPDMVPPMKELGREMDDKDNTPVSHVPLVLDRLDRLTLCEMHRPTVLHVQLILQCPNMTYLFWPFRMERVNPVLLGNTPFRRLRTLRLGRYPIEDSFLARMIELMPALQVLSVDMGYLRGASVKVIGDKECQARELKGNNNCNNSVRSCAQAVVVASPLCELELWDVAESPHGRIEELLSHCHYLTRLILTRVPSIALITTEWAFRETLEELRLEYCEPRTRKDWNGGGSVAFADNNSPFVSDPASTKYQEQEEEEGEGEAARPMLVRNLTGLTNIRTLHLPGILWLQLTQDAERYGLPKQGQKQGESPKKTRTLRDLVKLHEMDVSMYRIAGGGKWTVSKSHMKDVYYKLREMVPSLRRLKFLGEEGCFPLELR
ncbi:MAG: hypothetical protein J3R72DRAFT_442690 [Linnemannia gamsii]|nr:MAG: hypothetical protein J3R72DRAFT_442690 [Linnemannia gamsii]